MNAESQRIYDPTGRHDPRPKGYDKNDPWKHILPDRKELAVNLTAQFKEINRPHVVAIHSEWGSGKTLFQIAWQDWLTHCQEDGKPLPYFYFNAWEKDYMQDPFVAFMGALHKHVSKYQADTVRGLTKKIHTQIKKWTNHLKPVLVQGAGVAACAAASAHGTPELGGAAQSITSDYVEKGIDNFCRVDQSRDDFIANLGKFGQQMLADGCPLIVMVDELDRCRPSYAIALMESIKHLFSVPGVVFVLALDKDVLSGCFESVYGLKAGMGYRYLDRFIDVSLKLPEYTSEEYFKNRFESGEFPIKDFGLSYMGVVGFVSLPPWSQREYFNLAYKNFFIELVTPYTKGISLRDVNQAMSNISILSYADNMDAITFIECAKSVFEFFHKGNNYTTLRYSRTIGNTYHGPIGGIDGAYTQIASILCGDKNAKRKLTEDFLCQLAIASGQKENGVLFCSLVKSWFECSEIGFYERIPPYLNFLKKITYQAD